MIHPAPVLILLVRLLNLMLDLLNLMLNLLMLMLDLFTTVVPNIPSNYNYRQTLR